MVVIDDDDDDDDSAGKKKTIRRDPPAPAAMDPASWTLIQKLQRLDNEEEQYIDDDDDDVQVIPAASAAALHVHDKNASTNNRGERRKRRRDEAMARREREDLNFALLLQEQESNSARSAAARPSTMYKGEVLDSLQPCQLRAVEYVKSKAKKAHEGCLPQLKTRVAALGFTEDQLQECLNYIRDDSNIVIHMKEETLSLLIQDTHYRNRFEMNISGENGYLKTRKNWEARMFGGAYCNDSECSASDRPKYGCLNVTGDVRGVAVAAQTYGEIHIILQPHVRHRATFFSRGTGNFIATVATISLATNEYYGHVLVKYSDEELKSVLGLLCGSPSLRVGGAPSKCATYKEVQIHGPVCLATDVQALSLPGRAKQASPGLVKTVEAFRKIANCNVLWQGDITNSEETTT